MQSGTQVGRRGDLVEQLRGDGADRDEPARPRVLGDHRRPVGLDLGDRGAGVAPVGDLVEEGVVPAGGLRAALDDVARDDRARERVERVPLPAVPPRRRAHDQRRVGDAAGDDDVRARAQGLGDAPTSEVGVRRHRLAGHGRRDRVERAPQVVALDVRDPRAGPELLERRGEPGRVEPARVGDDLDAAGDAVGEDVAHLRQEGLRVPGVGVLGLGLREDEHRQLGEVVAAQDVDRPAVEHLPRGVQPVAVEAGAVPDTDRSHRTPPSGVRPVPGSPAKACPIVTHSSAASPTTVSSRSSRWRRWVISRAKWRAGPVMRSVASSGPQPHVDPSGAVSSTRTGVVGWALPCAA